MLYIIRHGVTEWNKLKKLQGRTDIPLNEEGIKMAQEAAKEYADIHFDIAFCSPLERAKQTAQILLENRDVPIVFDDRLREMSFGVFEGLEYSFDDLSSPVNVLFKTPENYTEPAPGGESLDELFERTGDFLESVVMPLVNEGKDVLIVGHGAMNSSIVCRINDIPVKDFWSAGIPNCKLMKLI